MEKWFSEYPNCQGAVSILFTDDAEIRHMNHQFRGKNSSTDVLTFPSGITNSPIMGDIAISLETASRQAKIHKHSLSQETAILALHGALHLAGLDDISDSECEEMHQEMARICELANVKFSSDWSTKPEVKIAGN